MPGASSPMLFYSTPLYTTRCSIICDSYCLGELHGRSARNEGRAQWSFRRGLYVEQRMNRVFVSPADTASYKQSNARPAFVNFCPNNRYFQASQLPPNSSSVRSSSSKELASDSIVSATLSSSKNSFSSPSVCTIVLLLLDPNVVWGA
jgi:hypothetical protein